MVKSEGVCKIANAYPPLPSELIVPFIDTTVIIAIIIKNVKRKTLFF
jgi:hypothetical protein